MDASFENPGRTHGNCNDMGTALHCACQRGHLEVAMWLAERAALNIVTSSRVTLLHSACDGGNIQIVEMLCDKGLDPGAKDIDMRCVMHLNLYVFRNKAIKICTTNSLYIVFCF